MFYNKISSNHSPRLKMIERCIANRQNCFFKAN